MIKITKSTLLLGILAMVTACLPVNISNTFISDKSTNNSLMGNPNSNPYYGELNLKIDTSLANAHKENSRQFYLAKDENTFSTKNLKLNEIVYNKIIKLNGQEQIINESFNIPDITKKYSILVIKMKSNDNIDVKINDIPQINNSDFEQYKYLANKQTILQSSNNINIKLNGNINNSIILTIVESSKVDIVRKKIENIKWKEITQNSRQQTYYPNDLTSLGDLKPYDGDIADPRNLNNSIGVSTANDTEAVFNSGYVAVTLKEPAQQNLDILKNRLKATVESFKDYDGNKIAILKVNYDQTDLTKIYNNFKDLNTFSQAPIKNATFSSINSAKTISTFIDILVNHSDLVFNAGLLTQLQQNGLSISPDIGNAIVTDESQKDANYTTYTNTAYNETKSGNALTERTPKNSKEAWHLQDTNISRAWRYSLGQNTNVGVFDTDFYYREVSFNIANPLIDNLGLNSMQHDSNIFKSKLESLSCPDFSVNGETSNGDISSKGCSNSSSKNFSKNVVGHGYNVSSILASSIDDNYGNAGVSPRSKLTLFTYESLEGGINGLVISLNNHKQEIMNKGIDVINISSGKFLSLYSYQQTKNENKSTCLEPKLMHKGTQSTSLYLCDTIAIQAAKDIFELSNVKKYHDGSNNPSYNPGKKSVIFVSSAGNSNKEVDTSKAQFFFPSSFSNVINVGAYEIDNNKRIRADFSPKIINDKDPYIASNYGQIDIWAPGDNIAIMLENESKWINVGGTSFSSPIIAGITALIKSLEPNLDVNDVRDILQKTGRRFEDESTFKSNNPKYVDAEDAIKEVILRKNKPDSDFEFKSIRGTYNYNPNANNNNIKTEDGRNLYTKPSNVNLYPNLAGKDIIAYGWFREGNYFDVLQMFEKKQPINYGTKSVSVIQPYSQIPVVGGDKIAIPLNEDLKSKLSRIWVGTGTTSLNLLEVLNDYAIYGVDNSIPDGAQTIIMKYLDTNETILTFEQALYKTAIALGLKPQVPVTFSNGVTLEPGMFISDNSKLSVKSGDTVGVSLRGDLSNISIGIGDKSVTLQSIVDDYVSFKIPPDLPQGVQDVVIKNAGGNITFKDALDILVDNPIVPQNNKIGISGNPEGARNSSIYSVNTNGSNISNLNVDYSYAFGWSPDKTQIVYGYGNSSGYNLWKSNHDGTGKKQLTYESNDDYPAWSPKGDKIAFLNNNRNKFPYDKSICIVSSEGENRKCLISYPEWVSNGSNYTYNYIHTSELYWSNDGKKISYNVSGNIHIIDIDTLIDKQLTNTSNSIYPNWTKDNKVVYLEGQNQIIKVDPISFNKDVIYIADECTIGKILTSTNGSIIAFSCGERGMVSEEYLKIVDYNGKNETNLVSVPNGINDLSWSADGKSISYVTRNMSTRNEELWTVNIDGSDNKITDINFKYYDFVRWSIKNYKK